jgi:hypothetical protein
MPTNDENKNPNDIRNYWSSPGNDQTPRRRRRIVTSDEGDDQQRPPTEMPAEQQRTANSTNALHQHVLQNRSIVQLSSDDDSMYVPLPRPQPAAADEQPGQQQLPITPIITTDTPRVARTSRTVKSPQAAAAPDTRSGRKRTRSQHLPSSSFVGEAEESSTAGDQTSECAEDDTHGADLYRQAIASCRNATKARTQLRAATTKCRVCAKFASFLDHFL